MPHIPDSRHADHDALAIAAYAAGDATGIELETASDLVAACADCAALHADLRAIASALPALPAPARTRDFILTPEQAASLRPAGWRRLLAPLAGPRFAFAGPLGGGLATLGLAGLLVAGSLGVPIAGSAPATPSSEPIAMEAASVEAPSGAMNQAAPAPAAQPAASGAAPEGNPNDGDRAVDDSPGAFQPYTISGDTSAAGDGTGEVAGVPEEAPSATVTEPSPQPGAVIGVVGLTLLAAGLALAGLRLVARRTA